MKNATTLLFFIFISNIIFSQSQISLESEVINERITSKENIPKVTGQLLGYSLKKDKELKIEYSIVLLTAQGQKNKFATVDEEGNFELELENGLPYQQIWLSIGDYYFGEILANSDLKIIADLKKLRKKDLSFYGDGIAFKGLDGAANKYINQYIVFKQNNENAENLQKEKWEVIMDRKISIEEKFKKIQKVHSELKLVEEEFIKSNPSEYEWILENEFLSEKYGTIFSIHWGEEIDQKVFAEALLHQPMLVSNASTGYYSYLNTMLSILPKKDNISLTESFLKEKVSDDAEKIALNEFLIVYKKMINQEAFDKEVYKTGATKFLKKYKKEFQELRSNLHIKKLSQLPDNKSNIVKLIGGSDDLWRRLAYEEKVLPSMKMDWSKAMLQKQWEADKEEAKIITSKLQNSKKLDQPNLIGKSILELDSGAKLYTSTHDNIEAFLQAIKTNYKGEAIIIDIWATWCGPCIYDMIESKDLKKELKKLPVEMLYICTEDSRSSLENWKKKVVELGLPGDHLFLSKKLSRELMNHFKFTGYPSFIFLNRKGNFDPKLIDFMSNTKLKTIKKRM